MAKKALKDFSFPPMIPMLSPYACLKGFKGNMVAKPLKPWRMGVAGANGISPGSPWVPEGLPGGPKGAPMGVPKGSQGFPRAPKGLLKGLYKDF